MFFETCFHPPSVSSEYAGCRELYLAGKTLDARKEAIVLRKRNVKPSLLDMLLCADISKSCGYYTEYNAISRRAYEMFSNSWEATVQYARTLASRRYILKSLDLLNSVRPKVLPENHPLLDAMLACTNAMSGFRETSKKYKDRALSQSSNQYPLFWYELAYMAFTLTDWDEAIEFGYKTLNMSPQWHRARVNLVFSLLACGRSCEADKLIQEGLAYQIENEILDFVAGVFEFARGDLAKASSHFARYLARWKLSRAYEQILEMNVIALWEIGRFEEARDAAQKSINQEFSHYFSSATTTGTHKFIPIAYIAQKQEQCVPTAAVMVSTAQGIQFDVDELFKAMHGRNGTPLWRMCDEMEERGFRSFCIKAEHEPIKSLLDIGIPMIGILEGLFSGHVEVICGYNESLSLYYLRDPITWYPLIVSSEEIKQRYSLNGNAVIALISQENQKHVQIPDEWISEDAGVLLALMRACRYAQREKAEILYDRIRDHSNIALLRDLTGCRITLTPKEYIQSLKKIGFDKNAHPVARFKALLLLGEKDSVDELKKIAMKDSPNIFVFHYIKLISYLQNMQWEEALKKVNFLLERNSQMEILWSYQADIKAELGDLAGAQDSITKAREISPRSGFLKDKDFRLRISRICYDEKLKEIMHIIEENPDDLELKFTLTHLLREGPDGLAYEKEELECVRQFPKDPGPYNRLAHWYISQQRDDLAEKTLANGRKFIEEKELPRWDFEKKREKCEEDHPSFISNNSIAYLFQEAKTLVSQEHAQHPDELIPIKKLLELDKEGQLTWFQSANLLALRISSILSLASDCPKNEMVYKILPGSLHGPQVLALTIVLENIDLMSIRRDVSVYLLEWCQKICKGNVEIPDLRFYLAVLQEQAGHLQRAISEYQSIQREFPGYGPSFFRLGNIYYKQGRIRDAIKCMEKCMESVPGIPGVKAMLADIYNHLGNPDKALYWQEQLLRKYPYSPEWLLQSLQTYSKVHGYQKALEKAEQMGSTQTPETLKEIKAAILSEANQYSEAKKLLADTEHFIPSHVMALRILLLCAAHESDMGRVDELSQAGLSKWPDDLWILEMRCQYLAIKSPPEAKALLEDSFIRGNITSTLAARYLSCFTESPADIAIGIVQKAPVNQKAVIAESFAGIFESPHYHEDNLKFLQWCDQNLKQLTHLRKRLAIVLNVSNKVQDSVRIAQTLWEEDKEDTMRLELMARCIHASNPQKALEYLKLQYEKDESVECLILQGRCLQLLKKKDEAMAIYWKVLEMNPCSATVLTNLYLMGENPQKLITPFQKALDSGTGVYDAYFHITAVKVALATKTTLPISWLESAKERHKLVSGWGWDEKYPLGKAIIAWLLAAGEEDEAEHYGGMIDQLQVRIWPGSSFVPKEARRFYPTPLEFFYGGITGIFAFLCLYKFLSLSYKDNVYLAVFCVLGMLTLIYMRIRFFWALVIIAFIGSAAEIVSWLMH